MLHICILATDNAYLSIMLAATGSAFIRAASPKLAQLAGSAVASYHAVYDVGNSTNIKWCVCTGCCSALAKVVQPSAGVQYRHCHSNLRLRSDAAAGMKELSARNRRRTCCRRRAVCSGKLSSWQHHCPAGVPGWSSLLSSVHAHSPNLY